MSFPAQVFRILIASPSDVTEERDIAVRAIQEWNDLNASERQLVLLPLRWETHSAPEYGKRPQEIINQQVVDHCDLLVGIFWTRVGSPTGVAESGTIEEIERVAADGKPVMLYFSQAKQDPDNLDLEQLAKLREFKKKTFPNALIENYTNAIEFKEKISKQIEIQLRILLAARVEKNGGANLIRPITDIALHFADPESGTDSGTNLSISSRYINVTDFDAIPDFVPQKSEKKEGGLFMPGASNPLWLSTLQSTDANKNYYRQRVTSLVLKEFFHPIRFWLKNFGGIGARDIYIDLSVQGDNDKLILISKSQLPTSLPSTSSSSQGLLSERHPISPDELISKAGLGWTYAMDIKALQPQRELSPSVELFIGAREKCEVTVTAKIFADTLPEPIIRSLALTLNVECVTAPAERILSEIITPAENA